jgi:hypothetical protein
MIIDVSNKKRFSDSFGWYQNGIITVNLKRVWIESMDVRTFVKKFKETVVHEYIHYLFSKWKVKCSVKSEEGICEILEKY